MSHDHDDIAFVEALNDLDLYPDPWDTHADPRNAERTRKPMNLDTARFLARIQQAKTDAALKLIGKEIAEAAQAEFDRDAALIGAPSKAFGPQEIEGLDLDLLRKEYRKAMNNLQAIKVSGTSFRQPIVAKCKVGDKLELVADPYGSEAMRLSGSQKAQHPDPNAILLLHPIHGMVGYVPKDLTEPFIQHLNSPGMVGSFNHGSDNMDAPPASKLYAVISAVVGGTEGLSYGLRVIMPRLDE